jgi:hypothetical protein
VGRQPGFELSFGLLGKRLPYRQRQLEVAMRREGRWSLVFVVMTLAVPACVGELEWSNPQESDGGMAGAPDGAAPPDVAESGADAAGPQPGDGLVFLDFPAQRPPDPRAAGDVLQDIVQHLPTSYGDQYYFDEPITWAHETTHGINSELRNYHNNTGKRANGFYVLANRGVILVEPDLRKSDANMYVPQKLRGFRYETYMSGQQAWDDTPTYIFDEWVAYTNGGAVGVALVEKGLFGNEWQDGVYGQLEFVVYSMALGMAVEAKDPDYFQTYPQFREFLAWNTRRAMEVFRKGRVMTQFQYDVQDTYFETLRSDPSAQAMRDFISRTWGEAFLAEILAPL